MLHAVIEVRTQRGETADLPHLTDRPMGAGGGGVPGFEEDEKPLGLWIRMQATLGAAAV